jgi:hypothetical protein
MPIKCPKEKPRSPGKRGRNRSRQTLRVSNIAQRAGRNLGRLTIQRNFCEGPLSDTQGAFFF